MTKRPVERYFSFHSRPDCTHFRLDLSDAGFVMNNIEELLAIREAAGFVFNGLMCGCIQMSLEANRAHRELVDRFFLENADWADHDQYEEARLNIFHFINLIDRAIDWKKQEPTLCSPG